MGRVKRPPSVLPEPILLSHPIDTSNWTLPIRERTVSTEEPKSLPSTGPQVRFTQNPAGKTVTFREAAMSTPAAGAEAHRATRSRRKSVQSNSTNSRPSTANGNDTAAAKPKVKLSVRKKSTASASPAAPTPAVPATADDEDDDNITVLTKPTQRVVIPDDDGDTFGLNDVDNSGKEVPAPIVPAKNDAANRPWGRKGKEPLGSAVGAFAVQTNEANKDATGDDVQMVDAVSHPRPPCCYTPLTFLQTEAVAEQIDEGVIDPNDVDPKEFEDPYDPANDPDAKSHVSLSDNDDEDKDGQQDLVVDFDRPWKVEGFDVGMREKWERMYTDVEMRAIGGDWGHTEDYQNEKV
jgi:hypothetical protein